MSLEDYESDLTELSSDEEDIPQPQAPPTSGTGRLAKAKKNSKAPVRATKAKEYELENVLKAPRQTTYSTKALYDMMEHDFIYLDPPYQRGFTWGPDKQLALIDSIFTNVAIPQIIFSNEQLKGGREKKTCMDGKQRLTSIRKFFNGEICFKHPQTGKRLWYTKSAGSTKTVLSKNQRQMFENKQITCIEYDSLTEEQQREIFQRVQNGVALTPAERMRAAPGDRADLARTILKQVIGEGDFFQPFGWGKSAGRDFHCLVLTIYFCSQPSNVKFITAPALEKWLQERQIVKPDLLMGLLETFKILVTLIEQTGYKGCFENISQSVFPFAGLLVYLNRKRLSLGQLKSAIMDMRDVLRRKHGEERFNGKVVKTLYAYIKTLNPSRLSDDGKDDLPAADVVRHQARRPIQSDSPALAKSKPKRKRAEVDSDDDEDVSSTKRASAMSRVKGSSAAAASSTPIGKVPTYPATVADSTTVKGQKSSANPSSWTAKPPKKITDPLASPAMTKVKRKIGKSSTPVALPDIPISSPMVFKFDIPTSLPDLELDTKAVIPEAPPPDKKPPLLASAREQSADPSPSRQLSDRLAIMRQAKLESEKALNGRASPSEVGGVHSSVPPTNISAPPASGYSRPILQGHPQSGTTGPLSATRRSGPPDAHDPRCGRSADASFIQPRYTPDRKPSNDTLDAQLCSQNSTANSSSMQSLFSPSVQDFPGTFGNAKAQPMSPTVLSASITRSTPSAFASSIARESWQR